MKQIYFILAPIDVRMSLERIGKKLKMLKTYDLAV